MNERWIPYLCNLEGRLASILVDLEPAATAPRPELAQLVWLRLTMRHPRPDGLSSEEEFPRLGEIEEALAGATGASRALLYVGRCTSGGSRDFYFYAGDAESSQRRLTHVMTRFPDYHYELGTRAEPGWNAYTKFLHPGPRELQRIDNRRVLAALAESGDRAEATRPVRHWALFSEEEALKRFLASCSGRGYRCTEQHRTTEDVERPYVAVIEHQSTLDPMQIDQHVFALLEMAQECGGTYDGWEAAVVK